MVAQQFASEEHRREHAATPFGIGLEVPDPFARACREAEQPQNQRGECADEEQYFESLGLSRSRVAQCKAPAVAFEITKRFLDLHAPSVNSLDQRASPALMGQRGGEQPRRTVQSAIKPVVGAIAALFSRPARSTPIGPYEIQPTPVTVTSSKASHANMAHTWGGLSIQRIGVTPAPRLGSEVFDSVADPTDPVPAVGLDIAKPRSAETRIGDDDGSTALGQYRPQSLEKSPVGLGAVVVAHRMNFFVHRYRATPDRHRRLEHEQFPVEFAVGPIHNNDRAWNMLKQCPRQRRIHTVTFNMEMTITQQSVHGLDVVFHESLTTTVTAKMGERELAAAKQRLYDAKERFSSRPMSNHGVAFKPFFQQANRVHAVLSVSNGCVATPIRSDDSMHVDPLSDCIPFIYH